MESGHETTSYGNEKKNPDRYSVISQIFQDKERESPNFALRFKLEGDVLAVYFISYEMFLPQRIQSVEDVADRSIKEMVKHLKKEYRAKTRTKLELKEDKKKERRTTEKVSMNERYMYTLCRFFDVS